MPAKKISSYAEHVYEVSGVEKIAHVHNPEAGFFQPDWARVIFRDGEFEQIEISGPYYNKQSGKLMKAKRGFSGYDRDDFDGPEEPLEPMPEWAALLVQDEMVKAASFRAQA